MCGPSSTSISAALDAEVQHNSADGLLELYKDYDLDDWSVSNGNCPITSFTLVSADPGITLTEDSDDLVASLAIEYSAPAHIGEHYYTIRATADGGATADTDGTFLTYHWCYAQEADTVESDFGPYNIPESGH